MRLHDIVVEPVRPRFGSYTIEDVVRISNFLVEPVRPRFGSYTIEDVVRISNFLRENHIPGGAAVIMGDTYAARWLRDTMPTTGVETLRAGDVTF